MWKLRYAVLLSLLRASNGLDGKAPGPTVPALKLSRVSFHSFSLYLSFYVSWFSSANKNNGPCRRVAAALVTLTEMELHGNS